MKGKWKEFIKNITYCDKLSAIAGFLPPVMINFWRFLKPDVTATDFEEVKLSNVWACSRRYDSYKLKCAAIIESRKLYNNLNEVTENIYSSPGLISEPTLSNRNILLKNKINKINKEKKKIGKNKNFGIFNNKEIKINKINKINNKNNKNNKNK
jgi:hypothetical protein